MTRARGELHHSRPPRGGLASPSQHRGHLDPGLEVPALPHTCACASEQIHLRCTETQRGGREATPGFTQTVCCCFQLLNLSKGSGLVGTSNRTDRSSSIVISLQMTLAGPASPRLGKPRYPACRVHLTMHLPTGDWGVQLLCFPSERAPPAHLGHVTSASSLQGGARWEAEVRGLWASRFCSCLPVPPTAMAERQVHFILDPKVSGT